MRRRSSCEVSARGLSVGSLPLILVDAAGLLCGSITLAITLSMRGSLIRPRSWGTCPEGPPGHGR